MPSANTNTTVVSVGRCKGSRLNTGQDYMLSLIAPHIDSPERDSTYSSKVAKSVFPIPCLNPK